MGSTTPFQVSDNTPWKRRFFTIWIGQAVSLFGSNLMNFVLIWWIAQKTGSATALATASLAYVIPSVLVAPFAGVLVDRWNRRAVMVVADGVVALSTLALALLFASGQIMIWHAYVIMALRSFAGAFQFPAMASSTSLMVPEKHLTRVSGFNQMLNGGMSIIAPPIAALLLASQWPMANILMIDVFTALFGILPVLLQKIPQPPAKEKSLASKPSFWREMREGLHYVASWRGLILLMAVASLANFLLTPSFSMLPLFVSKYMGLDEAALASINSIAGVGVILGGLVMGSWGGFKKRMLTSAFGLFGIGLGTTMIGFTQPQIFWFALAGMFIASFLQAFANAPIMAIMQSTIEPSMQGRVFTLSNTVSMAMSPLSLAVAGPIADRVGVPTMYAVSGVACILLAVGCILIPELMNIDQRVAATTAEATPEMAVTQPVDAG
jgi:MFS transporter, DHA3 family, macrolide efflux protein